MYFRFHFFKESDITQTKHINYVIPFIFIVLTNSLTVKIQFSAEIHWKAVIIIPHTKCHILGRSMLSS